jgi:iron complex outermembrane receptor protein
MPLMARAALLGCLLVAGRASAAEPGDEAEQDDEVIDVTVSGTPHEGRDPTPAVYSLRGPALAAPGRTLGEALAGVPGAQIQRSGGSADLSTLSLRGGSSAESPVYLAGIRLNDELTGSADLSRLPLWMLHRVEIYRGHAPAGLDALGMSGAVLLEPRLPRGIEALAALGVGSFGEREARAGIALGDDRSAALLAVRRAAGEGDYHFVDDRGTRFDASDDRLRPRQNADHEEIDAWALGRLSSRRGTLLLVLNAFDREAGAPGLQLPGARRARAGQHRLLAGMAAELACPRQRRESCALEIGADLLSTRYLLDDPLGELGGARRTESEGQRSGQRLHARFEVIDDLELRIGGAQQIAALAVSAERSATVRARRHLLRADADGRLRIGDRAEVAVVTALECHSTMEGAVGGACGVLEPVGRVGTRVRLLETLDLLANVGRYLRVPTLGELYGVSASVLGNADLDTEEGLSFDAGLSGSWRQREVAWWGQIFGFARLSERLIGYRRASLGSIRPYNTGSARILGVELATGASLYDTLHARVAVTALDPRDVSDDRGVENDLLPYRSRLTVAPELELTAPRWPLLSLNGASLAARFRYRGERVADPAGLVVLEADSQLDLDAALFFVGHLAVRGRVANLLDQRSFDLVGYPLPGRSYHALVEGRW